MDCTNDLIKCKNELIVCGNISNNKNNKNNKNNEKLNNDKELQKIIYNIHNSVKLSQENIDFIKLLSEKEKMEIILEYDKIVQILKFKIDDILTYRSKR
jgi:hypothetical protein